MWLHREGLDYVWLTNSRELAEGRTSTLPSATEVERWRVWRVTPGRAGHSDSPLWNSQLLSKQAPVHLIYRVFFFFFLQSKKCPSSETLSLSCTPSSSSQRNEVRYAERKKNTWKKVKKRQDKQQGEGRYRGANLAVCLGDKMSWTFHRLWQFEVDRFIGQEVINCFKAAL